jgi:hypothetical protein
MAYEAFYLDEVPHGIILHTALEIKTLGESGRLNLGPKMRPVQNGWTDLGLTMASEDWKQIPDDATHIWWNPKA